MADKTKAQLQAEIVELHSQIKVPETVEQIDEAVKPVWAIYQAYIRVGFNERQAWELVYTAVDGASHPKKTLF